jgi:CRP-like cAMP-binding protein
MPSTEAPFCNNLLLRAMSHQDLALLKPHLTRIELEREQMLVEPGQPIAQIYFLEGGIASVVSDLPETAQTEVGVFGLEGMSGVGTILGADTATTKTYMQVDGIGAFRIDTKHLRAAIGRSPSLQMVLLKYVQTVLTQLATSAVSNANHRMEARLARWLLMCHDRVDGDEIALTHRFMSMMITAQRSGVTVTLHILEGVGAIRSTRGLVTVLNRNQLEDLAGDAYGAPEAEYRQLLGVFGKSTTE